MLVKVLAAAIQGINATLVTIEVNALRGIKFYLVGLPDNAVKESQQRINSALNHNGLRFPSKQIIVNMAPADIKKEGSAYDLPIAIGILAADEVVNTEKLEHYLIMGELGLDGKLMPIKGALPITLKAKELGYKGIILPEGNAAEAAVVNDIEILGAGDLMQVMRSGINTRSPEMRSGFTPKDFDSFRCRSYIALSGVSEEIVSSVFGKVNILEAEGEIAFVSGDMCEAECNDRLEVIKANGGEIKSRIRLL